MRVLDVHDSTPVAAPSGIPPRLYVQLGAFEQVENAQRLADKLSGHGFQPIIVAAPSGAELLHRVRLGPLPSVESADELVRKLLPLGFAQRQVVVE